MDIDWEELQRQIKDLRMGEKVTEDINAKYASLVKDFTKEKFPEWQERLGPIVRDIIESHKENPDAAAEALLLVILQMVYQLAQHEVLFEYGEKFNSKIVQKLKTLDERTAILIQVLIEKNVISEGDFGIT